MYKILSTLSRTSSALYESKSYNIITRRDLAVSSFLLKKGLDPTADVILLGNKDKQIKMKYSEVLDKVKTVALFCIFEAECRVFRLATGNL